MELYIKELTKLKASSWTIITTSSNLVHAEYDKSIVLLPDIYSSCPATLELINALTKRFSNNQLTAIAICCICSYDYTISHESIDGISAKDFLGIWGHIETLQKSSSIKLSRWLSEAIHGRSQDGYNFKYGNIYRNHSGTNSHALKTNIRRQFNATVKPIGALFTERYFGESSTISKAMETDWLILMAVKEVYGEPRLNPDIINPDPQ